MFRCGLCDETTKPGEGMTKVVVHTRHKDYRNRHGEVIGHGFETVREIAIGPCCKEKNK